MASNTRNRHQRYGARNQHGFGVGWTLFSIVMVVAIFAMGFYAWNALRAGDAIASTQMDASAEQAPPAGQINEATAAPEATAVGDSQTLEAAAGQTVSPAEAPGAVGPESSSEPEEESVDTETIASPEWPTQQFPGILPFPSASYETYVVDSHADIQLPTGSESGFKSYAAQLVNSGASIYLDNGRLIVLALGDVEIQLVANADSPSVSLCGESAIPWEDSGDVLPQSGRLVAWEPGEEGFGAILTYRCVSLSGLMDYLDLLKREGWTSSDQASPVDGTFFATYQRGDRTITADYYANSSNFQIILGTKVAQ